ncbi:MAG: N-acetyltransferase family protein [Candidatus Thorarchaeota archaeon]|jgi:GNAT superfamily N-acetyltransferase
MDISIVEWKELDFKDAAQLIYNVFTAGNEDWGKSNSPKTIEGYLEEFEDDGSCFAVRAHSEGNLIGFAVLKTAKGIVDMNPTWLGGDPFISPDLARKELIKELITKIQNWAIDKGKETVIFYRNHSESITRRYQRVALESYLDLGFRVREKDIFMGFKLNEYDTEVLDPPPGYDVIPVREVDYEAVYSCFYETFSHGQSPFFFDQSDTERREYFETWSKPESLEADATVALLRGEEVVAFSFARPYGTPGNYLVEWIGVHPNHRRRGLGEFLMKHIANVAKDGGYETMSLSCATTNTKGYALYNKLGWFDDGGETIMAMKLN